MTEKPTSVTPLEAAANALREWQRSNGPEHGWAPTTMFIDFAERPAQAVLDGLKAAGYTLMQPCDESEDTWTPGKGSSEAAPECGVPGCPAHHRYPQDHSS